MALTLLGAIAEGIALTNIDATAAKLSLEFNCLEESADNVVKVEIPVRDKTPINSDFNKACGASLSGDVDDESTDWRDSLTRVVDSNKLNTLDSLVVKAGGRAP